ncbi:hypothetical protein C0991_000787 [Blastosporella zonata]|nr:hypothetical protein C0991_000787 [Blastosporella zonata]
MSSDVLANFACLDELTQVIYQGVYRFVVISTVSDQWTINLGLSGPEGRWWRGSWTEANILKTVGSKSSDKLLEAFAEKLAETLIQGELHVSDWSAEEGAKIKLTFGPSSKKPLDIPLVEITSVEAASYTTDVLLDIALQAQSRKCHLHPDQFATTYVSPPPRTEKATPNTTASTNDATHSRSAKPIPRDADSPISEKPTLPVASGSNQDQQREIKALKAELAKQQQRAPSTDTKTKPTAAQKPLKGASLANPNKKARKYQAIEFESDEE